MSDLIDSLSRNLRGYWCPMLQYGGLALRDQTRFKNNGTLTNMDVSTDWVMSRVRGRSGRVLDFDGTNDFVWAPAALATAPPALSASVWFRSTSTVAASRVLFGKYQFTPSLARSFLVRLADFPTGSTDKLSVLISADGTNNNSVFKNWISNTVVTDGLWKHAVFTLTANTLTVYINGQVDSGQYLNNGTVNTVFWDSVTPFLIGAINTTASPNSFFPGQIAEACYWNRALKPGEMQELYRLGPGWYQPQLPRRIPYSEQQAGFKAYWHRRQSQLIGGGV